GSGRTNPSEDPVDEPTQWQNWSTHGGRVVHHQTDREPSRLRWSSGANSNRRLAAKKCSRCSQFEEERALKRRWKYFTKSLGQMFF
ncbi:unnamed protein product, partial [Staurois parvus]